MFKIVAHTATLGSICSRTFFDNIPTEKDAIEIKKGLDELNKQAAKQLACSIRFLFSIKEIQ